MLILALPTNWTHFADLLSSSVLGVDETEV